MDYVFWFRKRFPQLLFATKLSNWFKPVFSLSRFGFQSLFARESVLNEGYSQRDYA
jgi:hypothetical protein